MSGECDHAVNELCQCNPVTRPKDPRDALIARQRRKIRTLRKALRRQADWFVMHGRVGYPTLAMQHDADAHLAPKRGGK
jgi:hypothetical protein